MANKAGRTRYIGLTGGIASGKSLVANCFAELGVPIVDTDLIARQLVTAGSPALQEIRLAFGEAVITQEGALDRAAMRRIVFSDPAQRARLEAILHPRIRRETERQMSIIEAPYLIVVVPLLAESPMQALMDRILVVDCSEATQVERLIARDAESAEHARRIMATQASRNDRLAIADDVITNDGTVQDACEQVRSLHRSYSEMAATADS